MNGGPGMEEGDFAPGLGNGGGQPDGEHQQCYEERDRGPPVEQGRGQVPVRGPIDLVDIPADGARNQQQECDNAERLEPQQGGFVLVKNRIEPIATVPSSTVVFQFMPGRFLHEFFRQRREDGQYESADAKPKAACTIHGAPISL